MASNPTDISIPFQQTGRLHLRVSLGPCHVRVRPGTGEAWVSGRYEDPTGLLPLQVTHEADQVRLAQSTSLRSWNRLTRAPSLEIELGRQRAFELTIEGGANESVLDLGGVPISALTISQGAGKSEVDFTAPNPEVMTSLQVAAGGVALEMRNLANAGFQAMSLAGGAAAYRLDFGGQLSRDAEARLNTGISSLEIGIPSGTAARVTAASVLGAMDVGDGFMTREGAFWNEAAVAGRQPALTVVVTSAFGSVRLRSTRT
jgi:hypothetical protein